MGANIKTSDPYVYFLYSERQLKERTEIENKIFRTFVPGSIIVNGKKYTFTEMSKSASNRYADCKVVAEGYKSTMNFTSPSSR